MDDHIKGAAHLYAPYEGGISNTSNSSLSSSMCDKLWKKNYSNLECDNLVQPMTNASCLELIQTMNSLWSNLCSTLANRSTGRHLSSIWKFMVRSIGFHIICPYFSQKGYSKNSSQCIYTAWNLLRIKFVIYWPSQETNRIKPSLLS